MKIEPTIIVDSREQQPWTFANLATEPGTLATGDYSVKGLDHLVAVERKSLPDLLGCIGSGRDRFKRELQRLRAYRFRLLVIETNAADLDRGDWRSKIQPSHVLGSLAAWTAQYTLPIWLAGDHEAGATFAERFLYQAARTVASEAEAVMPMLEPIERKAAKERQTGRPKKGGKLPPINRAKARDKIARSVGMSAATLAGAVVDAEFEIQP